MRALSFALLSLASAAQAQNCSDVIEIPALPGFDVSTPSALTCDGRVVAGTAVDLAFARFGAYRWSEAQGLVALGTLGGVASTAVAISCQGEVIVGHAETAGGEQRPFRWTEASGMEDLLVLSSLGGTGAAYGVSADGQTVVGVYSNGSDQAFAWSPSAGLVVLPGLGSLACAANALSDDGGVVVGWSQDASSRRRAVRWTAALGVEDLGTLGGGSAEAFGVSGDGQVIVGWSSNAVGIQQAFRWTQATGMVPLAASQPLFSNGRAVNRDGSVIGGGDSLGVGGAFLWTPDGGLQGSVLPDSLATVDMTPGGSVVLIAGSKLDTAGNLIPAAYVVRTNPVGTKFCGLAAPNSTGCSGYISAVGTALVSADSLMLSAARLPANAFGFFLSSQTMSPPTAVVGSQGLLCLGGAIGRFVGAGQVQNSGAAGRYELRIGLTALPTPTGLVSGVAGETWSFQSWHRDANPGAASNLTDAVFIALR